MFDHELFRPEEGRAKDIFDINIKFIVDEARRDPNSRGVNLHSFLSYELFNHLSQGEFDGMGVYTYTAKMIDYLADKLGRPDLRSAHDPRITAASLDFATEEAMLLLAQNKVKADEQLVRKKLAIGDCLYWFFSSLRLFFGETVSKNEFTSMKVAGLEKDKPFYVVSPAIDYGLINGSPKFIDCVGKFIIVADEDDEEDARRYTETKIRGVMEHLSNVATGSWKEELGRDVYVYLTNAQSAAGGLWASDAMSERESGYIIYGMKAAQGATSRGTTMTQPEVSPADRFLQEAGLFVHELRHIAEGRSLMARDLNRNRILTEMDAMTIQRDYLVNSRASYEKVVIGVDVELYLYREFLTNRGTQVYSLSEWSLSKNAFFDANDKEIWQQLLDALGVQIHWC